jgi:hypothetical protein
MESQFTNAELQLGIERSHKYKGTAKIDLNDIAHISQPFEQHNVDRLCTIFRKEGCRRLEVQNHVTAVVSQQHLHAALQVAGKSNEALLTLNQNQFPHLRFPAGQVRCLHGRHRIRAGKEVLPISDRWWTVDLYLEGICDSLFLLHTCQLT